MTSALDASEIAAALTTARYGRSLRVLTTTDSTNDDARRDAAEGAPDGHVVVADQQRAGRGSHGRHWSSSSGTDLYLSVVARPSLALAALPPLTLAVGLGVSEGADEALAAVGRTERTRVKWPNDVWLSQRKCAGILVETVPQPPARAPAPVLVIGIGLNVNRTRFPPELRELATSLRGQEERPVFDRAQVLSVLLAAVERWVDRFIAEGGSAVARALDAKLALRGQRVRCGELEGTLLGVAASGALRLRTARGPRELIAGRIEPLPADPPGAATELNPASLASPGGRRDEA